jgi:HJR/Mrr/RecB family endonuclease
LSFYVSKGRSDKSSLSYLDPIKMSRFCVDYYHMQGESPHLMLDALYEKISSCTDSLEIVSYITSVCGLDVIQSEHHKQIESAKIDDSPSILTISFSVLKNFNHELMYFRSVAKNVFDNITAIISVFSSQKLRMADETIDYNKILKVLNKNFSFGSYTFVISYASLITAILEGSAVSQPPLVKTSHQVGFALESRVEGLYRALGYVVATTPASGDFGVDILVTTNLETTAIQCKNYSGLVGVEAVMQVHSGGHYYGCNRFAVYSMNGFSQAALDMAQKLRVELLTLPDNF